MLELGCRGGLPRRPALALRRPGRYLDGMDLLTAADIAIRALAEHLHPQAIILFGSVAKGTFNKHSDLEFLIVVPREVGDRQALLNQCREAIGNLPVPVDFLVFYPDEVA